VAIADIVLTGAYALRITIMSPPEAVEIGDIL